MRRIKATIDGESVTVEAGATILDASGRSTFAGIPALCHRPGSAPQGGCRLCQVRIEGRQAPAPACSTLIEDGMVISTATDELEADRRQILGLLAERYPGAAHAFPSRGGRKAREFRDLLARYEVAAPESSTGPSALANSDHPYLRFSSEACIVCRRCVQACEDLQGQFVFSVGQRGANVQLLFGENEQFGTSECVSCGACVEECPTGALFDVDREATGSTDDAPETRTVCGYCGVGCNVNVQVRDGAILRLSGTAQSLVNHGHLCAKGRYAHGWVASSDRLTQPLLREDGQLRPVSWDHAMAWVAGRITEIRRQHGPDALGVLTSSRSTNEAAYLLQKLWRAVLGTNNVDCCARVCHASTALALSLATGTGAASASYTDIEKAGVIVVAGANPTEAHPIIGARIKQAARRGAKLIVIDPRRIELANYAVMHLQLKPGSNVALFNGLAKVIVERALVDWRYVEERTEGFEAFCEHLHGIRMADVAAVTSVAEEQIREAALLIGANSPTLFVTGLGLSELTQGTDSVLALTNIAMLTGNIGRPGTGMLPLRGQNNVQGNADMGSAPNYLTGYQSLDDPALRASLKKIWGRLPPEEPGWTIPEMLAGARRGDIKALWIQGEDVVQSDPNEASVIEALESLDLLVVQELFLSETARYADLVLPAAGVFEQDGTFTNGERRIQRVRAARRPPGEARADWEVARDLGVALGAGWSYPDPSSVMAEIANVAPGLFGGVSYDRLDGDGLQWPCPDRSHPGTETVHADGFLRGRGRFTVADHRPSPERADTAYPYILITGRVLQHYNVGSMTRRTANVQLAERDWLDLCAEDALLEGIVTGDMVTVESHHGRCEVAARVSADLAPGTLFLSFHFPETHANALTGLNLDPAAHCPEYKLTAVSLRKAPPK